MPNNNLNKLDQFTLNHLHAWCYSFAGFDWEQTEEKIKLFLNDLDEDELKYWLARGWKDIKYHLVAEGIL